MRTNFIGVSLLLILLGAVGSIGFISPAPVPDPAIVLGMPTVTAAGPTGAAPDTGAGATGSHTGSAPNAEPSVETKRAQFPATAAHFGEPRGPALPAEEVTLYVASEKSNSVRVFRGNAGDPKSMKEIAVIPAGKVSHNLGSSQDGKWVAVPNRVSGDVTIIDTAAMKEVARVKVGRRPHDPAFSADGKHLFVSQEAETYTSVIEVGSWRRLANIEWGTVQHDIMVHRDGRHLWMTVGNIPFEKEKRRVWVYDLQDKKVAHRFVTPRDAHDLIFTPDFRDAWITNSGYPSITDTWMTVWDVAGQSVAHQFDTRGYPFHSPRWGKDGNHLPAELDEMWFSDRINASVFAVDLKSRQIVARLPAAAEPFHMTMSPGGFLFTANFGGDSVTIYDTRQRKLLGEIKVPGPHGLSVVVRP